MMINFVSFGVIIDYLSTKHEIKNEENIKKIKIEVRAWEKP